MWDYHFHQAWRLLMTDGVRPDVNYFIQPICFCPYFDVYVVSIYAANCFQAFSDCFLEVTFVVWCSRLGEEWIGVPNDVWSSFPPCLARLDKESVGVPFPLAVNNLFKLGYFMLDFCLLSQDIGPSSPSVCLRGLLFRCCSLKVSESPWLAIHWRSFSFCLGFGIDPVKPA